MIFCGRCDQPIRDGEPYTTHDIHTSSSGGRTDYRHVAPCKPVPTQTSQAPIRH